MFFGRTHSQLLYISGNIIIISVKAVLKSFIENLLQDIPSVLSVA
jgi:hypothetical protein